MVSFRFVISYQVLGNYIHLVNKIFMSAMVNEYHYNDVKMSAMVSQITSLTIVYSTVYSGVDQKKL